MIKDAIPLKIAGVGYSVPENVVTNNDLTKLYDTSDEWIFIVQEVFDFIEFRMRKFL